MKIFKKCKNNSNNIIEICDLISINSDTYIKNINKNKYLIEEYCTEINDEIDININIIDRSSGIIILQIQNSYIKYIDEDYLIKI